MQYYIVFYYILEYITINEWINLVPHLFKDVEHICIVGRKKHFEAIYLSLEKKIKGNFLKEEIPCNIARNYG